MRELLPFSAYNVSRWLSFTREWLAMGTLWFVWMTTIQIVTGRDRLAPILIGNSIGAVMFGVVLAAVVRVSIDRKLRQLYYSVPSDQYRSDVRVLCGLLRGRVMVWGHLYIGVENWVFVPQPKARRAYRLPVQWEEPERIIVSTEPAHLSWLQKFAGLLPTDRLVVSDAERRDLFMVPDAHQVCNELTPEA